MTAPPAELERARAAAAACDWPAAFELFAALGLVTLAPEDQDLFADCAWWTCRAHDGVDARRAAYAGFSAAGDHRRAAYSAWFLFYEFWLQGDATVACGWLARAERHLEDAAECVELALVAFGHADVRAAAGDRAGEQACARQVVEIGERLRERNVIAMGRQRLGRALVAAGSTAEGLALLDDAMVSVLAGEVSPFYTGFVYCNVIGACVSIADLRRAGEWTDAAMRWCLSLQNGTPFHGICRVHRVQILALSGEWDKAEAEARRARDELQHDPLTASEAWYELGEILRRRGDLPAAEDAFADVHRMGGDPQPGLGLVRFAQGRTDSAAAAVRLALSTVGENLFRRTRLLAAQVEIALASDDFETARVASAALADVATSTPTAAFDAAAEQVRASVLLAEDALADALHAAERARRICAELRMPYEAARARMTIAAICRGAGDDERARLELETAREAFDRLGARPDAVRAAEQLGSASPLPRGLSAREHEVLRLVAAGKTNREIAAEMVLSEHTVSRHLQNIFRKLDVSTRAAATAFAFEHALV